ncbi:hypothetical protein J6590_058720, partial [Homalodisca vitripennis]
ELDHVRRKIEIPVKIPELLLEANLNLISDTLNFPYFPIVNIFQSISCHRLTSFIKHIQATFLRFVIFSLIDTW